MKTKILASVVSLGLMGTMLAAPISSYADGWHHESAQRNQWNGFALGSALLGLIGVASHNNALAVAGGLGAVYSEYRGATISRDRDRYDRGWNDRRDFGRRDRW